MATSSKRRKRTAKSKPLPTIWEIPDDLWERIRADPRGFWPRKPTGRRHANWRLMPQRDHLPDAYRLPVGPVARASSAPRAPFTTGSSAGARAA